MWTLINIWHIVQYNFCIARRRYGLPTKCFKKKSGFQSNPKRVFKSLLQAGQRRLFAKWQ